MIYLQVENLTKSVGDRILFADVTFGVNEGDKIGIIAKNGTGKTTMLGIIAGHDEPDSGTVTFHNDIRVGYLAQTPYLDPDLSVARACMNADTEATRTIAAYEEIIGRHDASSAELDAAMQAMDAAGAWDYEERLRQMLSRLGITDLSQPVSQLSGGQRKRVALARILLDEPQMLILDEPTNHLDIDVIEWLEGYLRRSRVSLLMVTHDRYFLDRVCNRIIEIDRESIYTYDGNFNYYLRRRQERIEAMAAELAKVRNTLRKEQEWMNRQPQARAGKAKYRIDAFHDLKERSRVNLNERQVNLGVESTYIGSKIFEAEHVCKSFGDKKILDDFSYIFARREKLGIICSNGVGKSTFIKLLQGILPADSGEWNVGETVRFGYYSQDGLAPCPGKKVIDVITDIAEDVVVNDKLHYSPMQFLQHFLFNPADQQKYVDNLSGGERCRLHLASVLMRSPNFLILDEPTNDLDIVTLGILEEYLVNFSGCVIVISHDRYFLDNIVDHLFVMQGNGVIKDFPGNYSDYRAWIEENAGGDCDAKKNNSATQEKQKQKPKTEKPNKMTFAERREFESLEKEIEALTEEKQQLDRLFAGETDGKVSDIADASARYSAIINELDEKELRWLELSEKQ